MLKDKKKALKTLLPYVILLVIFLLVPAYNSSAYMMSTMIMVLYYVIGSSSLRTISLSGNLSFAHGSFIALGAYCCGILAKNFGLPALITIPAGALFATLISIITGLPFIRLRGLYYSMASMFMGVTFVTVIKALKVTGGYRGLTSIPALFKNNVTSYYFFIALTVFCLAILYRFEHCRIGISLRALAQSNDVAASIGINPTFYKLLAVGMGSFIAGMAGGAYALYSTVLSPTNYDMTFSLWLLMYMMIGGEKKFIGPILGAIIFGLVPELGRGLSTYAPYLTGGCTLLVAYLIPGGLSGIPDLIRNLIAKRKGNVVSTKGGVE